MKAVTADTVARGTVVTALTLDDASALHKAAAEGVRTHALALRVDAKELDERLLAALQELVVPGGTIDLTLTGATRRAKALARTLGHWFEATETPAGERFPRVRPEPSAGDAIRFLLRRTGGDAALGHFDDLADAYAKEIPAHLVAHYRDRKLDRLARAMPDRRPLRVLDIGCGVGLYAREAAARFGVQVVAADGSAGSVRVAARGGVPSREVRFAAADATLLPFGNAAFDVVYAINVVHHLKRGDQARFIREAARVLAPGGRLVLFEINTRNPLFRWYMRKVFPKTRRIDRGDEEFLAPRKVPLPEDLHVVRVETYTFLPDFLPRWALAVLKPVEGALEALPTRAWGIHYTMTLSKDDAHAV